MSSRKKYQLILFAILLLPVWMWLAWALTPKRKLVVAIVDKTVLNTRVQEHISLDWILNHERFSKTSKDLYDPAHDYFGFFPGRDDDYRLKGLERFSGGQIRNLSNDADLVYFTDTYGIYNSEWFKKMPVTERSRLIYGGMTQEDIDLLQDMKAKHKLMISEFNSIGSPTPPLIRDQFERMFGLHWSGWTARYFISLDTNENKELPRWLVNNYLHQTGRWPFHKDGLAFVRNDERVVILEYTTHLTEAVPSVESTETGREELDLPKIKRYPFWFDILDTVAGAQNQVAADFVIHPNKTGADTLGKNGIPTRFPAVLMHNGSDYRFYYFSGDFCDNPIGMTTSYFKGISLFKWLFYDASDQNQRVGFFWSFYRPMMNRILNDYYSSLQAAKTQSR